MIRMQPRENDFLGLVRNAVVAIPLLSLWAAIATADQRSVATNTHAAPEKVNVNPEDLKALIATADRMTVLEHEEGKKLYESSNQADIRAFDDAIHPKVPDGVYACLCEATVTVNFYKSGKQIEKIQYIAPDEITAEAFNSYTHVSEPQDLLNWFVQRDIKGPEEEYQGYYRAGLEGEAGQDALPALKQRFPKFDWNYKTAVHADLDGDGWDDVVMLGYAADSAAVGVVMDAQKGGKPVVKILEFGLNGGSMQRAVSGHPNALAVYLTDKGVEDAVGQLPEGYKICDDCFQIEVQGDGDSDPLWIYWNHVKNDLDWWRA